MYGESPLPKGALYAIKLGSVYRTVQFQYNPNSIKESQSVDWGMSRAPGQFMPIASANSIGAHSLDFELFLFGRGAGSSCDKQLSSLQMFALPDPAETESLVVNRSRLVIGERSWSGVVTSVTTNHLKFDRQLSTTVASVSLRFVCTSFGSASDRTFLDSYVRRAGQ